MSWTAEQTAQLGRDVLNVLQESVTDLGMTYPIVATLVARSGAVLVFRAEVADNAVNLGILLEFKPGADFGYPATLMGVDRDGKCIHLIVYAESAPVERLKRELFGAPSGS